MRRPTTLRIALSAGLATTAGVLLLLARLPSSDESPTEEGAKQFASSWLKMLATGDLMTGKVLTDPPHERPAEGTDLRAFFASDDRRRQALEDFHEDRLVRMLKSNADSQFTFTRAERFDADRGEAVLWYRIEYIDPTEGRSRARVELHLQYAFGTGETRAGWWVREVVFPFGHEYVWLRRRAARRRVELAARELLTLEPSILNLSPRIPKCR